MSSAFLSLWSSDGLEKRRARGKAYSPPREEGWTRSGRGGRSHRSLVVSDHPVCGAEVGFAEIFLMPHPPLLTRRGISERLVLHLASPSEDHSDKNTDDINPCHHSHKEQHGRD